MTLIIITMNKNICNRRNEEITINVNIAISIIATIEMCNNNDL